MQPFEIDADICRAGSLPAGVYLDRAWFERVEHRLLPTTWQYASDEHSLPLDGGVAPAVLLPGSLEVPVAWTRSREGAIRCLSNVCTHRGNLLATSPRPGARSLVCGYHGRCFDLAGRVLAAPGFESTVDFPRDADHLPEVPHGRFGGALFASLRPRVRFDEWMQPVRDRLDWLPLDRFEPDPGGARAFDVAASWIAYCDNYLEGFHVPYVHPGLAPTLSGYRTELLPHGVLQIGLAAEGEPAFEPPEGHPDAGQAVGAYYFWLFPGTMLNFYPWGLSLNAVQPLGPGRTRVLFRSYVHRAHLRCGGPGGDLDQVELEDEQVVEQVQRGLASPLYERGTYSPEHEQGVHHFHRLLADALR